jgi:chromosome segregation ATPase
MQIKKLKETKKDGMLKDMLGRDLKKMRRAIMSRVKDFQQLYDLVKNQRNRFVNLIQAARQGICEMKDKQRITMNELEILRAESAQKEQLLAQRRTETQRVVSKQHSLRAKLNKLGVLMRERQNKVDEQIAEIDKLTAIITTTEKEMIRLRKQYEVMPGPIRCCKHLCAEAWHCACYPCPVSIGLPRPG